MCGDVESLAVVGNPQYCMGPIAAQLDVRMDGLCVLDDILQGLLSDPVQRDLHMLRQLAVRAADPHRHLGD